MANYLSYYTLQQRIDASKASKPVRSQLQTLLFSGGVLGITSPDKQIFSICGAGLSNRIINLINTMYWAERLDMPFLTYWSQDAACQCSIADIFDSNRCSNVAFINKLQECITQDCNVSHICDVKDVQTKQEYYSKYGSLFFHTWVIPNYIDHARVLNFLKSISIAREIKQSAKEFINSKNINKNTQGILLRGTDGKRYNIKTDDKYYFNYILRNPNTTFFVTSDEQKLWEKFSQLSNVVLYPTRSFVEYDSSAETVYRNKASVIDGFINMLILSKTNIINATGSSFQRVAQLYSELDII